MSRLARRQFMCIAAAAAGSTLCPGSVQAARREARWRWSGMALGARASITIAHSDLDSARHAALGCVAEIRRLERIFSLFQKDSAVSRLNRNGVLREPPPELLEVLALARALGDRSSGAFDVSVQPLWSLYQAHFGAIAPDPAGPPPAAIEASLAHINYRDVAFDATQVRFEQPQMALTLNGIAQGFVSDRIVTSLRGAGLHTALVDTGEIRAAGVPQEGPWRIGLPGGGAAPSALALPAPRAIATSEPRGFVFESSGKHHHLFDPRVGISANRYQAVTVLAPSAALADGLSTACAALDRETVAELAGAFPDVQVRLLHHDGSVHWTRGPYREPMS